MDKEIDVYAEAERLQKEARAYIRISKVCIVLAVVCFIIAAVSGMHRLVDRAEAESVKQGYCLVEDSGIWQNIQKFKIFCR